MNDLVETAAAFILMVNSRLSPYPRKNPRRVAATSPGKTQCSRGKPPGLRNLFSLAFAACADPSDFGFCRWDGSPLVKPVRLPAPRRYAAAASDREKPPQRRGGAGRVGHRTQKKAVNPLTRLASRSVMRRNYQSLHVEGPAAIFDPFPDREARQTAGQAGAFLSGGSSGWPKTCVAPSKRPDAP